MALAIDVPTGCCSGIGASPPNLTATLTTIDGGTSESITLTYNAGTKLWTGNNGREFLSLGCYTDAGVCFEFVLTIVCGGQNYDIEQLFYLYEDLDPNAYTGGTLYVPIDNAPDGAIITGVSVLITASTLRPSSLK